MANNDEEEIVEPVLNFLVACVRRSKENQMQQLVVLHMTRFLPDSSSSASDEMRQDPFQAQDRHHQSYSGESFMFHTSSSLNS